MFTFQLYHRSCAPCVLPGHMVCAFSGDVFSYLIPPTSFRFICSAAEVDQSALELGVGYGGLADTRYIHLCRAICRTSAGGGAFPPGCSVSSCRIASIAWRMHQVAYSALHGKFMLLTWFSSDA